MLAMRMLPLQIEPVFDPFVWGPYFIAAAMTAAWVFVDGGLRGLGAGRLRWALGTFLALPVVLPAYLLVARPVGDLVPCPHCHVATLSHRAVCAHCGGPLAFDSRPAMWGAGEIIGVVLIFLFALVVALDAAAFLSETVTLRTVSILILLQNGVLGGLAIYVVRRRYRQPLTTLGMRWSPLPALAGVGVVVGLAALPISVVAEAVGRFVIGAIIGHGRAEAMAATEQAKHVLVTVLRGSLTTGQIAWLLLLVCVVVPIGEEIFFRGFVYGALRARLRVSVAVGLSALLFALVHIEVFHFFPIFVLGLILATLYERTHTLLPGMLVHGVNNVVAVLALLYKVNI